jgi:hypothetical protein
MVLGRDCNDWCGCNSRALFGSLELASITARSVATRGAALTPSPPLRGKGSWVREGGLLLSPSPPLRGERREGGCSDPIFTTSADAAKIIRRARANGTGWGFHEPFEVDSSRCWENHPRPGFGVACALLSFKRLAGLLESGQGVLAVAGSRGLFLVSNVAAGVQRAGPAR